MEDASSQGGFIVFLEGKNGRRAPITWSSRKLRRVARSTSSAETMSLLDGLGYGFMLKTVLREIFGESINIPVVGVTDSKNLRDAVYTSRNVDDKRHKIDICALRDMLRREEVYAVEWVKSECQLADALTKNGVNATKLINSLQGHLPI